MTMTNRSLPLYKGWTAQDFAEATYCGVCGLPMLKIEDNLECPICDKHIKGLNQAMIDGLILKIMALRGGEIC